jgi:NAD(P)-dependent dehydrogenase (short-subunit alcohol dehydrogenase family)
LGGAEAGTVVFIVADHARPEDCARCVKETLDAFGRIDILFNNAGWQPLSLVSCRPVVQLIANCCVVSLVVCVCVS